MLFLSGAGLAGVATAADSAELPASLRANVAGASGGALAALAVALGDYEAVLAALDASRWPGDPDSLRESLDAECTLGLTFDTWPLRGALPFCVVAFDCTRRRPVLFSAATSPHVQVARAVAAAAAWPGASSASALVDGVPHCDVEFFVSPLDVYAQLRPPRALAIHGSQPHLHSMPWRLVDHHTAFMASLKRPCVGFVAHVPGPHVLDSVLRRGSAAALLGRCSSSRFSRSGLWLVVCTLLGLLLTQRPRKEHAPSRSRAATRRARKREQRRRIGGVSEAPVWREGRVEGGVGQQTPVTARGWVEVESEAARALRGAGEVAVVA